MTVDLFWVLLGASYLLALAVQQQLLATHRKWENIRNSAGLTGVQTAQTILDANSMGDVSVKVVPGRLTDHYDPRDKTVALSESVYANQSVAATAIAAHEVGHAIQHKAGYAYLRARTAMAPVARFAARYGIPAAIFGSLLGMPALTDIGVLSFVGAFAFQIVTLPVEFDASRRALAELDRLQMINHEERRGARSMLRAAAMTYVAGAASAAVYVVYLALVVGRFLLGKPPPVPPPRLP
ncbi:MAG: zinc metallopeptidase [Woeseiaceae bacterium]|nr:zinc metallopeptidase [Woeseiaceae bacterium]